MFWGFYFQTNLSFWLSVMLGCFGLFFFCNSIYHKSPAIFSVKQTKSNKTVQKRRRITSENQITSFGYCCFSNMASRLGTNMFANDLSLPLQW